MNARQQEHQILILEPIGVVPFNVNAKTTHLALKIPIKENHPLNRQALTPFQEDMKYTKYILTYHISRRHEVYQVHPHR